jgi:hypothetical protein
MLVFLTIVAYLAVGFFIFIGVANEEPVADTVAKRLIEVVGTVFLWPLLILFGLYLWVRRGHL